MVIKTSVLLKYQKPVFEIVVNSLGVASDVLKGVSQNIVANLGDKRVASQLNHISNEKAVFCFEIWKPRIIWFTPSSKPAFENALGAVNSPNRTVLLLDQI